MVINKKLYESIMSGISYGVKKVINEYGYNRHQGDMKFNFDLSDNDFKQIDTESKEKELSSISKYCKEYYIEMASYYRAQMVSIKKWGAAKGFTDNAKLEAIIVKNHAKIKELQGIAKKYSMSISELADAILENNFYETIVNDEKKSEISKYIKSIDDVNDGIRQKYEQAKSHIDKYKNIDFDTVSYTDLISYKKELYKYINHYNEQSNNKYIEQFVNYIDDILDMRDRKAKHISLGYANGWRVSNNDNIDFYHKLMREWPGEYVKSYSNSIGRCQSEETIKFLNADDDMHNPVYIITYYVDSSD